MRHSKAVMIVALVLGTLIWCIGAIQPVYTDPEAPERLSRELADHPREQRFQEWYTGLRSYETSHKRLTDVGRGLIALGLGVGLALGITSIYRHCENGMRVVLFALAWIGLWAMKVPFTAWYYELRQRRFDFPVWGDSVGIPMMFETIEWITGCVLSGVAAALLMIGHSFDREMIARRPSGILPWGRVTLLWLWEGVLVVCIASAVWDGNEGMVISCLGACPLVYALITASPTRARVT